MTCDIEARLRRAALSWQPENTRLFHLLSSARRDSTLLRRFAVGSYRGAVIFKRELSHLLAITSDADVRLFLLENLLEEEGLKVDRGGRLRRNEVDEHLAWARRFTRAVGVADHELPTISQRTRAVWLDQTIDEERWLEGIAFLLVGMESNVPRALILVVDILRTLGYSEYELSFFTNHITVDERHGSAALQLVAEKASELRDPELIVSAVKQGADEFCRSWGGSMTEHARR